jgi:hypothetical protein
MNRLSVLLCAAVLVTACAEKSQVSVTHNAAAGKVQTKSRSEPIFYNGKTYQLDYDHVDGATFDMRVSGMGPKQQKDAVAVATSSLGYFACPEGQKGQLTGAPRYEGNVWKLAARCG